MPASAPFFDARLILRAAVAGTVMQIGLSLAQHFAPGLAGVIVLFGRMMLAATAGYLYGLGFGRGYGAGAAGGAVAGGLCAVAGLTLSVVLGDTPAGAVTLQTGISIFTGAVGGAFGQMGAILRKLGL